MPNIYSDRKENNLPNIDPAMKTSMKINHKVGLLGPPNLDDIEKTKDELIKFKLIYNKNVKDMNLLRIENSKLQVLITIKIKI